MYIRNNCCVHHFLKIFDGKREIVSNKLVLLSNKFAFLCGSIFRNHFVTNITFKTDLDVIIDSIMILDDIFL